MLDPYFKAMLDASAEAGAPGLDTLPPEMARELYRTIKFGEEPPIGPVDSRDFTVPGLAGAIPVRLYTPEGAAAVTPGIVFFHGGGWVIGDLDTHDDVCRRLADMTGYRVLAVDYRLAPENPFPASHDDCLSAAEWAFEHAAEIGFDPARIATCGDSAGGNLAASVAISLRDHGKHSLAMQVLMYPVTTFTVTTESMDRLAEGHFLTKAGMIYFRDALFGDTGQVAHPRVSVLDVTDLSGLAPAFVSTAGYDPLSDEGAAYAKALDAAGVSVEHHHYEGFIHGFYNLAALAPAVLPAYEDVSKALKTRLG
jgi:acetyl esterase